jgi:Apea-like HEPN
VDTNKKITIVNSLRQIAANIAPPGSRGTRQSKFFGNQKTSFVLIDHYLEAYEKLIRILAEEEGWHDKYSEEYIGSKLIQLVREATENNSLDIIPSLFDTMSAEYYNFNREHTCFLPLRGLTIPNDEYKIGKITLIRMTDNVIIDLSGHIEYVVLNGKSKPEDKEAFLKIQLIEVKKDFKNCLCSKYSMVGESGRVRERAEEETHFVLDILTYFIPALYPKSNRTAVGLQGEVDRSIFKGVIISEGYSFNLFSHITGPLQDFDLSTNNLNKMISLGFETIKTILEKPLNSRTNFETTILRGIHWFASSQRQVEKENELLNLLTSAETFLTPKDNSPISNSIAEGIAILLTSDLSERRSLKKTMKRFYGIRSGLSHGSAQSILDLDLFKLRGIIGQLISIMIRRSCEFNSQQSLLDWIEDQKLG